MKTIVKSYDVYSFDELNQETKERVINNHIKFFVECYDYENMSSNMQKAVDKAESMRTPWFVGSYIWDYCEDEILEECRSFDYLENGRIFSE